MRKMMMGAVLALCTALLLGGVVELDLVGDVQAQVKKKKDRCGAPDVACAVSGPEVRCHGRIYDSPACAVSAGWEENQCPDINMPGGGKKKIPPKKKNPPKK